MTEDIQGEGILNEQFLGVKVSYRECNIQTEDIIKHIHMLLRLKSINKWRSALKDLIHPSGHIFFGEVAIKNDIGAQMDLYSDYSCYIM